MVKSEQFCMDLAIKSKIDVDIINQAHKLLNQQDVDMLFEFFVKDGKHGKIPYFPQGFYPCEFYTACGRICKETKISADSLYLYIYVLFAQKSYELYKEAGLGEDIFFDTFCRISESVEEHRRENGIRGIFDYHFVANHVRGSIIRLGCFEYGYGRYCGKKAIYIHVPKSACMQRQEREKSYALARKYFGKYPIVADSWLLYPENEKMLSHDSSILDFARDFDIVSVSESHDYKELFHIFGRNADYTNPDTLQCDTTLQKMYANRIKEKQPIGSAVGILKI